MGDDLPVNRFEPRVVGGVRLAINQIVLGGEIRTDASGEGGCDSLPTTEAFDLVHPPLHHVFPPHLMMEIFAIERAFAKVGMPFASDQAAHAGGDLGIVLNVKNADVGGIILRLFEDVVHALHRDV